MQSESDSNGNSAIMISQDGECDNRNDLKGEQKDPNTTNSISRKRPVSADTTNDDSSTPASTSTFTSNSPALKKARPSFGHEPTATFMQSSYKEDFETVHTPTSSTTASAASAFRPTQEKIPPPVPPSTPNDYFSKEGNIAAAHTTESQQAFAYGRISHVNSVEVMRDRDANNNNDHDNNGTYSSISSDQSLPSSNEIETIPPANYKIQPQQYHHIQQHQNNGKPIPHDPEGQPTPREIVSVPSFNSVASSASSSSFLMPPAPPSTPVNHLMYYDNGGNGNGQASAVDVSSSTSNIPIMQSMATPTAYTVGGEGGSGHSPQSGMSSMDPNNHQRTSSSPAAPSGATSPYEDSRHPQEKSNTAKDETINDDFTDWKVGPRYELIRILGKGSYGEVAQARDLKAHTIDRSVGGPAPPKDVAIKRITSAFEQEVDALRLYREIHILRRLKGHECIIQLLDIVPPESGDINDFQEIYLVFEYVDTDLYKLIMSPQYLTTEHIQTFLYQMLTGLKYMHSSSVIHRDLKPANILLNEDCSLKICDFGLARIVNSEMVAKSSDGNSDSSSNSKTLRKALPGLTRQLTKHVVTRWYRAPELILIQPYTSAVDIWSLGCILGELLSMQEGSVPGYQDRVPLFPGGSCYPLSGEGESVKKNERLDQLSVILGVIGTPSPEDVESIGNANDYIKTLKKQPSKSLESLYPVADKAAIDLLKRMLQFNPKKRCTAEEALDHEFMKGVRRKEMERNASQPLIGPEFLNSNKISLEELKRKTYEEVMRYSTI